MATYFNLFNKPVGLWLIKVVIDSDGWGWLFVVISLNQITMFLFSRLTPDLGRYNQCQLTR